MPSSMLSTLEKLDDTGMSFAMPPVDLVHSATALGISCETLGVEFLADWNRFYWAPHAPGSALGRHRWWTDPGAERGAERPPDSFCLYGCIAVECVLALATLAQAGGAAGGAALEDAAARLRFASALFGIGGALDLSSSTAWPVSSEAIDMLLRRAAAPRGAPPPAAAGPSALELARRWQRCDPIGHHGCWAPQGPPAGARATPSSSPLVVTVVGEHAPFAHDVSQALQAAGASLGATLRFVFAGQYYLCHGFAGGCAEDPAKAWFRSWLSRWEAIAEPSADGLAADTAREADGLAAALSALPDARALLPDLFVCGDSALFCWLLRRRAASREALRGVPALHMLGMVLLQYVPRPWRPEMMADFRSWWLLHDGGLDHFAVFMETLGLQLQWQLGVVLPFVPSLGPAHRSGATYSPPDQGGSRTVLVSKSTFWGLPAGRVLSTVLARFVARLGPRLSLNWAPQAPSDERGAWLSFESMARHSCALFVPTELSQIRFRDMYMLGLPQLVPDDRWLLRLLRQMFVSWGQLHAEYAAGRLEPSARGPAPPAGGEAAGRAELAAAAAEAAGGWPHAPFYDPTRDPPERLAFWLPLADVWRYPHVARFSSLGDLLARAAETDWRAVSARMRAHALHVVAGNVEAFYQQSLLRLLDLGAAEGVVAGGPPRAAAAV